MNHNQLTKMMKSVFRVKTLKPGEPIQHDGDKLIVHTYWFTYTEDDTLKPYSKFAMGLIKTDKWTKAITMPDIKGKDMLLVEPIEINDWDDPLSLYLSRALLLPLKSVTLKNDATPQKCTVISGNLAFLTEFIVNNSLYMNGELDVFWNALYQAYNHIVDCSNPNSVM